jgi:hypothetical protein
MKSLADRKTRILFAVLCCCLHAPAAFAQTGGAPQVQQAVVAGGGGTSSTPNQRLDGTAGQSVTGTSSGGAYALSSGFWPGQLSFQIAKSSQTITFASLVDKTFGDADFVVTASASSGLPVIFTATGQCAISGNTVHLSGASSCTITASQQGDSNFNAATGVARSFQIARAATATALSSAWNQTAVGQAVSITAAITSAAGAATGAVQFKMDGADLGSPVALGAGATATFTTSGLSAGAHTVTANYLGDANFNASTGALPGGLAVGGVIEFSQPLYIVGERNGSVTITVRRTGDLTGALSVDYVTDDGRIPSVLVPCSAVTGLALELCDYTRAAGTLHFAAGEAEKTFAVLVNDDSYVEGAETVQLVLSNPGGGATLGQQSAATLQILDDAPESAGNPIEEDRNFVIQHYHDFLNREPDDAGLNFWTNEIKSCGADLQCREVKRVNISAAFFLSIEFQQTGYLVERMYKTAFGDATGSSTFPTAHQLAIPAVRLQELLRDTQEIGRGVAVLQGDWQTQLENNKRAFALGFVSRQRVAAALPPTLNAAQFVTQLDQNAGGVLSDADKAQLEGVFGGPAAITSDLSKRAQVLRAVAENETLQLREFNRAFVLMQYFGYLRRNPNDAQDTDYTGYDFWLTKLNQFQGDFVRAEMVRAFITSAEYRKRFGQ